MSIKSNSQAVNLPRRVIRMAQLREKIPFSESHLYALIQKHALPLQPFSPNAEASDLSGFLEPISSRSSGSDC